MSVVLLIVTSTVTPPSCGIQWGIQNLALDYELQIRKLLILLTPVCAWCCSKEMNPSSGHQNSIQRIVMPY